jgi:hypothetical protein
MLPEPFAGLDHGLGSGLSIDGAFRLGIIEKSMPGPVVHLDFIFLFMGLLPSEWVIFA